MKEESADGMYLFHLNLPNISLMYLKRQFRNYKIMKCQTIYNVLDRNVNHFKETKTYVAKTYFRKTRYLVQYNKIFSNFYFLLNAWFKGTFRMQVLVLDKQVLNQIINRCMVYIYRHKAASKLFTSQNKEYSQNVHFSRT